MTGPPASGKTYRLLNSIPNTFKKIESDKVFAKYKDWQKTIEMIRNEIINSVVDIAVEINPVYIEDLIDAVIIIDRPEKPMRHLSPAEEEVFYSWEIPASAGRKLRLTIEKELRFKLLMSRWGKEAIPPWTKIL